MYVIIKSDEVPDGKKSWKYTVKCISALCIQ